MSPMLRIAGPLLAATLVLCGCGKKYEKQLEQVAAQAAGAPDPAKLGLGRLGASRALVGLIQKGMSPGRAIDLAYDKLIAAEANEEGASSVGATAFAGAVLDAIAACEPELPSAGEFEFFWMKVGRLAFKSAEECMANQRIAEAQTLVFGGGERWQHEAYWLRYPDHDGLASYILALSGRTEEGIHRLESRPHLDGFAKEILGIIKPGN